MEEGEELFFDEPGRILYRHENGRKDGVDCRSHYFRVTKPKFGFYKLKVRHGGGEESACLKYDKMIIEGLAKMDSDSRYWMLYAIMDVKSKAETSTAEKINSSWRTAAAQKRIKTRKVKAGVKVWIDPAPTESAA